MQHVDEFDLHELRSDHRKALSCAHRLPQGAVGPTLRGSHVDGPLNLNQVNEESRLCPSHVVVRYIWPDIAFSRLQKLSTTTLYQPSFQTCTNNTSINQGNLTSLTIETINDFLKLQEGSVPFKFKVIQVPNGTLEGKFVVEIQRKSTKCHFLDDFPIELRNRVYEDIVIHPGPIPLKTCMVRARQIKVISSEHFRDARHHKFQEWDKDKCEWIGGQPSDLNILQTSKQIHAEATPIAYSNTFRAETSTALVHFARIIGPSIKHATTIDLGADCTLANFREITETLKQATGLRNLYFDDSVLHDLRYSILMRGKKARDDLGVAVGKLMMPFLADLQKAYNAQGRTWKASDLVKVRRMKPSRDNTLHLSREQAVAFAKSFRTYVGARLQIEEESARIEAEWSKEGAVDDGGSRLA